MAQPDILYMVCCCGTSPFHFLLPWLFLLLLGEGSGIDQPRFREKSIVFFLHLVTVVFRHLQPFSGTPVSKRISRFGDKILDHSHRGIEVTFAHFIGAFC